jgi:hypothetical protein
MLNHGMRLPSAAALTILFGLTASAANIEPEGRNSKAVAAAIQGAGAGDTVRLPEGLIELTEPIRPKTGVKLIGAGQDKTRLVYKGDKPGVVISISGCEDVEIAHLTIDGQENPLVVQGITGGNSRRLWLHHLTIRNLANTKTWGPHAILFSGRNPTMEGGVTDSRITDCRIENIGLGAKFGGGIRLAWGSVRNEVVGNQVHKTGRGGIFGDHSAELAIRKNRVTGSGGEGLGIEIWGGCPKSLIEDNMVDHWISVDQGNQSAVRRNVVGADDGTLKGYGLEIIARDMVVTDNAVNRGASIGLSVSNKPVKNNVFWGYNTVRDCVQWGAQLQGESGGIAHHYFYRCDFETCVRGDPRARYKDSGHGFRTNGACQGLVFEECRFCDNGGDGVQLGGRDVDRITFLRSTITGNAMAAIAGPSQSTALLFSDCKLERNKSDKTPETKPFPSRAPVAEFLVPKALRAGEPGQFRCTSKAARGEIVERLWDFGHGIPEVTAEPKHTYGAPGTYRVTLIVWDKTGQASRAEKSVQVQPGKP